VATSVPAPAPLVQPRALLLDFGGVVVSTTAREDWAQTLADTVLHLAAGAGFDLDRDLVEQSLRTGRSALSLWKNASSRRQEPRELAPGEIVEDFLLSDLPRPARRALALDAARILAAKSRAVSDHHVRPGIPELLALARDRGIGLGIVSNAHAGGAHREILREKGLDGYVGVQVYSDEVGIRKPHPGMIRLAAEALGADPHETWYVGDTVDRDVVAGRRAGAGRVIITRDRRTDHPPFPVADTPDLILDTPAGLLDELRRTVPAGTLDHPTAEAVRTDAAGSGPAESGAVDRTSAGSRPGPRRVALLLDHGGVLTTSVANPDRDAVMGRALVELSQRCGHLITLEAATAAMRDGWERHRARKRSRDVLTDPDHRFDEVDPAVLWGDLVGADLPEPVRADEGDPKPSRGCARAGPVGPCAGDRRGDRVEHDLRSRGARHAGRLRDPRPAGPRCVLGRGGCAEARHRRVRSRPVRPAGGAGGRRLRGRQGAQRRSRRARCRDRHCLPAARRQGRGRGAR
jgi:HAD superfamily hydrolase (TIGR01662 family)